MEQVENLVRVKKAKVTMKDLERNALRIQAAMDKVPVDSQEYARLAKELEQAQVNCKKFKEGHQRITLKDGLVIGGTTVGMLFLIALNREWPTAIKTASVILKWIPFKG